MDYGPNPPVQQIVRQAPLYTLADLWYRVWPCPSSARNNKAGPSLHAKEPIVRSVALPWYGVWRGPAPPLQEIVRTANLYRPADLWYEVWFLPSSARNSKASPSLHASRPLVRCVALPLLCKK